MKYGYNFCKCSAVKTKGASRCFDCWLKSSRLTPANIMNFCEISADGCWLWTKTIRKDGYGIVTTEKYKSERAHRVSWKIFKGPIPEGLFVCHKCDNPRCINPEHLYIGNNEENMRDCREKGRQAYGSRNGRAKLTESAIQDIREQLELGETQARLAAKYGVCPSAISHAIRGVNWKHS